MAFARWRRASALYVAAAALLAARGARADVELSPGPTGAVGAFLLVSGRAAKAEKTARLDVDFPLPEGVEPTGKGLVGLAPTGGRAVVSFVESATGVVDLAHAWKAEHVEAVGLAHGVLRVGEGGFSGFLSVGVDDGVLVLVDGKELFRSDDARAGGEDEHLVRVKLAAGDHPLVLKLHQRRGAWSLRLKILGDDLARARGVTWVVPGADAEKTRDALADVQVERRLGARGMTPVVVVRFRGGAVVGTAPRASAKVEQGGAEIAAFDLGEVRGPFDFSATLPALPAGAKAKVSVTLGERPRSFDAFPEAALASALEKAERAKDAAEKRPAHLSDPDTTVATIEHLVARVRFYAEKGDGDVRAQLDEAAWLAEWADHVLAGRDPVKLVRGAKRIAYRSPLDGKPSSFGVYVPPKLDEKGERAYPLVVGLHGLNGKPMNMMRWFFGRDDDAHDGEWEDRHPGDFPDVDAIVVTPMAHLNGMYRYASEVDVMNVVRWAMAHLPVDKDRVSVTGPSMGGTGTAQVAFHNPDVFAAAAPLCGYHSWTLRGDWAGKKTEWEILGGEERSTVQWAKNGLYLPLWIVHGTKDLPVENSGVLIDAYKGLGYSLLEEHPEEGHNVWQKTYEGMKGLAWLRAYKRPEHPSRLVLRTNNLRVDNTHWLTVTELERSQRWGDVLAVAKKAQGKRNAQVSLTPKGITALAVARDEKLFADGAVDVEVAKTTLSFGPGEAIAVHKDGGDWKKGPPEKKGLAKGKALSGPIRDVFHDPLVVVYGATDPAMRRANEALARHFAAVRPGFEIAYPVMADTEATKEALAGKAWVLVGTPRSNAILARLAEKLPIRFTETGVRVGDKTFDGPGVGAAFVHPNPEDPARYVVVLGAPTVEGTLRGMSLPDLLPDWIVWDHEMGRSRGGMILGAGKAAAGGYFTEAWAL